MDKSSSLIEYYVCTIFLIFLMFWDIFVMKSEGERFEGAVYHLSCDPLHTELVVKCFDAVEKIA